jgi:hypothetical protein
LMFKKPTAVNNDEIRKIVESTTDFFVWKDKKKKPLVRTTIFDS